MVRHQPFIIIVIIIFRRKNSIFHILSLPSGSDLPRSATFFVVSLSFSSQCRLRIECVPLLESCPRQRSCERFRSNETRTWALVCAWKSPLVRDYPILLFYLYAIPMAYNVIDFECNGWSGWRARQYRKNINIHMENLRIQSEGNERAHAHESESERARARETENPRKSSFVRVLLLLLTSSSSPSPSSSSSPSTSFPSSFSIVWIIRSNSICLRSTATLNACQWLHRDRERKLEQQ